MRQGQGAIADAQPVEQALGTGGKVAAQAKEAARAHRQAGDQRFPILFDQRRPRQRGSGDRGLVFRKMRRQLRAFEAPAGLCDHACAIGGRDRLAQRAETQPGGRKQTIVAPLPGTAEQIEQLPELGTRRTLAVCAVAQHGGKAVVEMHGCARAPGESGGAAQCDSRRCSNSLREVKCHSFVTRCKAGQLLS